MLDKTLVGNLLKQEEEGTDRKPFPAFAASAGRPRPDFIKAEPDLSGTIPWQTPAKAEMREGASSSTASHQGPRTEMAQMLPRQHHHHLVPLPQPPRHCQSQVAVTSCLGPAPIPAQFFWCDDTAKTSDCRLPPDSATSSQQWNLPPHQEQPLRRASGRDDEEEEEKFSAGMLRMVTRAELHRKYSK